MSSKVDDVVDEIFDMVRPANPDYVTMEDVLLSKMGVTMLSILSDAQSFFCYDQRENFIAQEEEEQEEQ